MCLSTGPRWPEEGGTGFIFLLKKNYDGVLLMWCNLKFESVLFRRDSRHNDRVDGLLECDTKQAVMIVAQWYRNQIIRGLWLLAKKSLMLTWFNFKFVGVLFNLDT